MAHARHQRRYRQHQLLGHRRRLPDDRTRLFVDLRLHRPRLAARSAPTPNVPPYVARRRSAPSATTVSALLLCGKVRQLAVVIGEGATAGAVHRRQLAGDRHAAAVHGIAQRPVHQLRCVRRALHQADQPAMGSPLWIQLGREGRFHLQGIRQRRPLLPGAAADHGDFDRLSRGGCRTVSAPTPASIR